MTLLEFLIFSNRIVYILLGILTAVSYLLHRDQARFDIALMFGSLATPVMISWINALLPERLDALGMVASVALIAQPYLLLHLVEHFRAVPLGIRMLALAGMGASWLVILTMAAPIPFAVAAGIIAYFVFVEGYAAMAFVHGGLATRGVTRWRLSLAAIGSGMLALSVLLIGATQVVPEPDPFQTLSQASAIFAALCYYLGFAPPRWLRRSWQLAELYHFLNVITRKPALARAKDIAAHLCHSANRGTGGVKAVVLWASDTYNLPGHASLDDTTIPIMDHSSAGLGGRALRESSPLFTRDRTEMSADELRLMDEVRANAMLAVPIIRAERVWGVLLVFLRRGLLFIEDDLGLLTLFAKEAAILLENISLFEQLQEHAEQLERKVEERTLALQQSEAELRALFEAMPDIILVVDKDGKYLKVAPTNPPRKVPPTLVDHTLYDYFPREQADQFVRQIHEALNTGETVLTEFSVKRSEATAWYALALSPMLNASVLWVARDITERKRVEESLRESEERFRQLAEDINEVFWLTNVEQNELLYISPAFTEIWGLPVEAIYENPLSFLETVHPDDRALVEKTFEPEMAANFNEQYRIIRPDGGERWIWARTFPIYDESGKLYRIAGIAEDMTERKKQEAQLFEQARSLAALEERQRLARDLHDAVSQALFSATMIAEALPRLWERDSERVWPKLVELRQLTRGALAEMRTLLLELRPTALQEAELSELLHQLIEAAQSRKQIGLTLRIEAQNSIQSDTKIALYRIAQEALNNIVKHADATEAELILRSDRLGGGELVIRDNGQGFDPSTISSTSLGLGIMRERAEAIGAHLDIRSGVGQGTQIAVTWSSPRHLVADTPLASKL